MSHNSSHPDNNPSSIRKRVSDAFDNQIEISRMLIETFNRGGEDAVDKPRSYRSLALAIDEATRRGFAISSESLDDLIGFVRQNPNNLHYSANTTSLVFTNDPLEFAVDLTGNKLEGYTYTTQLGGGSRVERHMVSPSYSLRPMIVTEEVATQSRAPHLPNIERAKANFVDRLNPTTGDLSPQVSSFLMAIGEENFQKMADFKLSSSVLLKANDLDEAQGLLDIACGKYQGRGEYFAAQISETMAAQRQERSQYVANNLDKTVERVREIISDVGHGGVTVEGLYTKYNGGDEQISPNVLVGVVKHIVDNAQTLSKDDMAKFFAVLHGATRSISGEVPVSGGFVPVSKYFQMLQQHLTTDARGVGAAECVGYLRRGILENPDFSLANAADQYVTMAPAAMSRRAPARRGTQMSAIPAASSHAEPALASGQQPLPVRQLSHLHARSSDEERRSPVSGYPQPTVLPNPGHLADFDVLRNSGGGVRRGGYGSAPAATTDPLARPGGGNTHRTTSFHDDELHRAASEERTPYTYDMADRDARSDSQRPWGMPDPLANPLGLERRQGRGSGMPFGSGQPPRHATLLTVGRPHDYLELPASSHPSAQASSGSAAAGYRGVSHQTAHNSSEHPMQRHNSAARPSPVSPGVAGGGSGSVLLRQASSHLSSAPAPVPAPVAGNSLGAGLGPHRTLTPSEEWTAQQQHGRPGGGGSSSARR